MNIRKDTVLVKRVAAVLLVILLIGAYIIIRRAGADTQPEADETQQTAADVVEAGGRADFLFVCIDDGEAIIAQTAAFDLSQKAVFVYSLPLDGSYGGKTLGEVYASGGLGDLPEAAAARFGRRFDRTIVCTEENFNHITELLGDAQINVTSPVSYSDAGTLIEMAEGVYPLTGDALYSFIRNGAGDGDVYVFRSGVFADMLRSYISTGNIGRGEELFAKLVNYADCDITAYDHAAVKDILASIAVPDTLEYDGVGLLAAVGSDRS